MGDNWTKNEIKDLLHRVSQNSYALLNFGPLLNGSYDFSCLVLILCL